MRYIQSMTTETTPKQPSTDISFVPSTSMMTLYETLIDDVFSCSSVGDIRLFFAKFPGNWVTHCSRNEEQRIKEKAIRLKNELNQYFTDPYVRESYNNVTPKMVSEIISGLETIINIKRERKTRRTSRSLKVTKVFKFNPNGDPDFKGLPFLTDPQKIVGALAVLIWIPKQKMAVWIQSKDNSGLAINKNNIVRFDPETSFAKRIRKPEELIQMLGESRKKMFQYLKSIKTVEYEIDGKMNKKYVIVKVW